MPEYESWASALTGYYQAVSPEGGERMIIVYWDEGKMYDVCELEPFMRMAASAPMKDHRVLIGATVKELEAGTKRRYYEKKIGGQIIAVATSVPPGEQPGGELPGVDARADRGNVGGHGGAGSLPGAVDHLSEDGEETAGT